MVGSHPDVRSINCGAYRLVDGVWHKRCAGPSHEGPVYLPATDKYFFRRHGAVNKTWNFMSRCRICHTWPKVKDPGQHHGWVPTSVALRYYAEAANRIGVAELSRRTGITPESISSVLKMRQKYVRKANMFKVMRELVSIRRHKEYSINGMSKSRVIKRGIGNELTCTACGVPQSRYTPGCGNCVDRKYHIETGKAARRARRAKNAKRKK